eukprot:2473290-Amphidinium_carterae.1
MIHDTLKSLFVAVRKPTHKYQAKWIQFPALYSWRASQKDIWTASVCQRLLHSMSLGPTSRNSATSSMAYWGEAPQRPRAT